MRRLLIPELNAALVGWYNVSTQKLRSPSRKPLNNLRFSYDGNKRLNRLHLFESDATDHLVEKEKEGTKINIQVKHERRT